MLSSCCWRVKAQTNDKAMAAAADRMLKRLLKQLSMVNRRVLAGAVIGFPGCPTVTGNDVESMQTILYEV